MKRNKHFFMRIILSVVIMMCLGTVTREHKIIAETSQAKHVAILLGDQMKDAKVAEYYQAFDAHVITTSYFVKELSSVQKDAKITKTLQEADEVIICGVNTKESVWNDFMKSLKKEAKLYYLYGFQEEYGIDYNTKEQYPQLKIDTLCGVWGKMYYARVATTEANLNVLAENAKPTQLAGFGVAVKIKAMEKDANYKQLSFDEYQTQFTKKNIIKINKDQYNSCIKLLSDYSLDSMSGIEPNKTLKLTFNDPITKTFKEKKYDVMNAMYTCDFGIWDLDQRYDDHKITAYDAFYLNDIYINANVSTVYEWNQKKTKWVTTKKFDPSEIGLKVIRWNGKKFTTQVFRYQDKVLRKNTPYLFQRDEKGNWYIYFNDEDGNSWVYQLNNHLQVLKKVCLSDLVSGRLRNINVVKKGKILISVFEDICKKDDMYESYNSIPTQCILVNVETGKIEKIYKNGRYCYYETQVRDNTVYFTDATLQYICGMNLTNGKIEQVVDLSQIPELLTEHEYSDDMGGTYQFTYSIYGDYLYLLKHNGIYRINLDTGSCRKVYNGKTEMFKKQDYVYTDFEVVGNNELYVLGVYFDDESATTMWTFTR